MIKSELQLYQAFIARELQDPTNATATAIFRALDKLSYPVVGAGLQLLMTYVVSSATAERSFSTLKRLKTYLRSTMSQDRLSGLAMLHTHSDIILSAAEILERFCRSSARRLGLIV